MGNQFIRDGQCGVQIVVLAAGGSRRMGRPKQVLKLWGKPLVRHAVDAAIACRADRVWVVVGAAGRLAEKALSDLDVGVVRNSNWPSGMSTSLRAGLSAACASDSMLGGIIVVLGDQPMITSSILDSLIDKHQAGCAIVACDYGKDVLGPPALFDRTHFASLRALRGDEGARRVLDRSPSAIERVRFPGGRYDVDTTADHLRARRFGRRQGQSPGGG